MNYELKQARERGCQCGDDEACQFVRERDAAREQVARLENALHIACGSCGTPTEPDIRICPKCLDAWIAGLGCEWLDKAMEPLKARVRELEELVRGYRADHDAAVPEKTGDPVDNCSVCFCDLCERAKQALEVRP